VQLRCNWFSIEAYNPICTNNRFADIIGMTGVSPLRRRERKRKRGIERAGQK
jgi:hypothetical protein